MKAPLAAIATLRSLGPSLALAEETICTPEFYINGRRAHAVRHPHRRPAPQHRAQDQRRYRDRRLARELRRSAKPTISAPAAFTIVNPGSLRERIDFVATDPDTGTVLHVSLIDEGLPFVRVDAEGSISTGHCVFEYDSMTEAELAPGHHLRRHRHRGRWPDRSPIPC